MELLGGVPHLWHDLYAIAWSYLDLSEYHQPMYALGDPHSGVPDAGESQLRAENTNYGLSGPVLKPVPFDLFGFLAG